MQDLVKSYKQFTTSYYVTEGLRITSAIIIPILAAYFIGDIRMGVTVALGVICVSICDSPGPLHHRINGMLIGIGLVFIIAIIAGLSVKVHWLIAVELLAFSFVFSMIGVYGARATSIGIAALLIMVLNIDDQYTVDQVWVNAVYILAGGAWYFIWSLLLNRLRPYKLAQQAIGDSILSTAKYMRIKASLYNREVDYDKSYRALLDEQVQLHNKQNLVREILFKTRSIVKDSSVKGRTLLAIFTDTIDLFEQIMTSQQDYQLLHKQVDEVLLSAFEKTILKIADELDDIGIAMQEGVPSYPDPGTEKMVAELALHIDRYRKEDTNEKNNEVLINLGHVLENMRFIYERMLIMHRYTAYDPEYTKSTGAESNYDQFVSPTQINLQLFLANLTPGSNIFRHSIRVSLTMFTGYILAGFLLLGHDYWILLTILVILKPAYSLTKRRNIERLLGTVTGAVSGAALLYFIHDTAFLLVVMIITMIGGYSLMRIKYFPFVVLMTVYLLISFYLLKTDHFSAIIEDRVVDTAIGSAFAFIATLLIPPRWEKEQIKMLAQHAIAANANYFEYVANRLMGASQPVHQYKLLRKDAYVAMANLSDTFQRMLSEPRNKQENNTEVYSLVVFNHLLLSHIATLFSYIPLFASGYGTAGFKPVTDIILSYLRAASAPANIAASTGEKAAVRNRPEELLTARLEELKPETADAEKHKEYTALKTISDQFYHIQKIAVDIHRMTREKK